MLVRALFSLLQGHMGVSGITPHSTELIVRRIEAFHHLFTHALPNLLIHLILTGASPTFLRRQVVHGGSKLDHIFQIQMLSLLYSELELRLSGARPPESSSSKLPSSPLTPTAMSTPPRDGVCFNNLAQTHGHSVTTEDDDHGACLCQLTACLGCFHNSARTRRGPVGPLPFSLIGTPVANGWTGEVESEARALAKRDALRLIVAQPSALPEGKGFVKNPRAIVNGHTNSKSLPLFPHPQMTDVLAVEEHLRWRLKEMGASDPAVESRYGQCTNAAAALEGIELSEDISEDGSVKAGKEGRMITLTRGKGKVRRLVNGNGKRGGDGKDKGRVCFLPKEWAEEDPGVRNMAVVLTFRHFIMVSRWAALFVYCSPPS